MSNQNNNQDRQQTGEQYPATGQNQPNENGQNENANSAQNLNSGSAEADQQGQDAENQGGSLASDGPVSQNEAGRGSDLTDLDQQLKGSDADYESGANNESDFEDGTASGDSEATDFDVDESTGSSALSDAEEKEG
ncbi:MAG: hypothetical protein EOO07_04520 [Chitinophagaceae bacterium]|nr:MAG: hypothetical protein EOO07_04520 [Chitinophagaceae bacterium]